MPVGGIGGGPPIVPPGQDPPPAEEPAAEEPSPAEEEAQEDSVTLSDEAETQTDKERAVELRQARRRRAAILARKQKEAQRAINLARAAAAAAQPEKLSVEAPSTDAEPQPLRLSFPGISMSGMAFAPAALPTPGLVQTSPYGGFGGLPAATGFGAISFMA